MGLKHTNIFSEGSDEKVNQRAFSSRTSGTVIACGERTRFFVLGFGVHLSPRPLEPSDPIPMRLNKYTNQPINELSHNEK